jgi:hypothetical protein
MLGWTKMLGSGELPDELTWIVDQYGEVLRANPQALPTVFERDQRRHIRATLTGKTLFFFLITHDDLLCFQSSNALGFTNPHTMVRHPLFLLPSDVTHHPERC